MEDSGHQSTESGALVGSNDDLLTEILVRLPASSILRFKSVSKHWRRLLSDRRFTLRYDSLLKSPGLFDGRVYVPFDVENRSTPPFRTLDDCFDHYDILIIQSCNGLLLCSSGDCDRGFQKYYVFNPTTKQFATIPSVPGGRSARKNICFIALAFDQTDCVHFKVFCISSLIPCGDWFQIQIYSSDTRKWKVSIESFHVESSIFSGGVYWNGAIHWAPIYCNHLYFKMDTEKLEWLPLPPMEIISFEILTTYFGESRGHLHFIMNNFRDSNNLHMNVYEMLSDHSGWFVKYQVVLDHLLGVFPKLIMHKYGCNFDVIDVVRGVKEEDTFLVLMMPGKLIAYNVHDKSFKIIMNLTKGCLYGDEEYLGFYRYTERLTPF